MKQDENQEAINTQLPQFQRVNLSEIQKQVSLRQGDNLYDLVKIKVHLDEHFYIFSRFLISRMLTLCRVRKLDAIQIAKEIKKQLIERNKLDITSQELQELIFDTMVKFKYESSVPKYQMVNRFYGNRTPMIILIFGAPCIGKSLIANHLAERLNVSNVLQTSIVETVMKQLDQKYSKMIKQIDELQDEATILDVFKHNCRVLRKGVSTDIQKCLSEGKPVIIEGISLMPDLYLMEQDLYADPASISALQKESDQILKFINQYIDNDIKLKKYQRKDQDLFNLKKQAQRKWKIIYPQPEPSEDEKETLRELKLVKGFEKIVLTEQRSSLTLGFQLVLNKQDHLYNIENNIPKSSIEHDQLEIHRRLTTYQSIQQFLLTQRDKTQIIPVNLHNLEETLVQDILKIINQDIMHDVILEKIETDFKRGDF